MWCALYRTASSKSVLEACLPYSGTYLFGQVRRWIIEFQIIEVPLYNQWDFADVHPTVGSCSLLFCRLLREKPNCSMIAIESSGETRQ